MHSVGCWCHVSAAALPAMSCPAHRQGWDSEPLFLRQVGCCYLAAGWLCLLWGSSVFQTDVAVCRQCSDRCQVQRTAAHCSWCSVSGRLGHGHVCSQGWAESWESPQGGWNVPSHGGQAVCGMARLPSPSQVLREVQRAGEIYLLLCRKSNREHGAK